MTAGDNKLSSTCNEVGSVPVEIQSLLNPCQIAKIDLVDTPKYRLVLLDEKSGERHRGLQDNYVQPFRYTCTRQHHSVNSPMTGS